MLPRSLLAAAGFAEMPRDGESLPFASPFNPWFGPTVFGTVGAFLATVVVAYFYRAQLRKLALTFELVVSVVSAPIFGFLFGVALHFLIAAAQQSYRI